MSGGGSDGGVAETKSRVCRQGSDRDLNKR